MQEVAMVVGRELEICAETVQACAAAEAGGADRIELCAALGEGGVNPSRGLIAAALEVATVPVHVLIRPRAGGFVYTAAEFRAMCRDVEDAVAWGAAGVVLGVLTDGGEIDGARTADLVRRAAGRPVTFHRAFDHARDLTRGLEELVDVGCSRVLTSGGRPTVTEGLGMLRRLAVQAGGRIRVAAGGGVTLSNAPVLVGVEGLDVHASLRAKAVVVAGADPLWQRADGTISVEAVRALSRIVHGEDVRTGE